MAIKYAFDLYPRTNPVGGARVLRFSQLQEAEYRGEANGTGSGRIIIRGTSTDAASIDPKGMQYVRVVRINTSVVDGATLSGFSEKVVGGFFLENGDYEALTERSTKKLTFGGAGTLSYLSRAVAAEQTYIAGADGPFDGLWHWYFSPAGSILWRMVTEALDVDRPQSPIAGVTMSFNQSLDSAGNAWPGYGTSWLFTAGVQESLVSIMRRLLEAGVYVWMDPDTFELSAWMANAHGRTRTGVAWGTSVIRFQAPSAATVATGNIKSDAKRGIGALVKRSDLLVGSAEGYEWVNDPAADLVWEGGFPVDDPTGTSLSQIGAAQLAARSDAGDTVRLRMFIGTSPTTGSYLPFETAGVLLDDRVTLHTGTGQWDWNETEQKVAAISLKLRPGGDWDAWIDLGSKYSSIEERAFANAPVGAHTHPPNPRLCDRADNILLGLTGSALAVSSTDGGNVKTFANDGDFAIASAVPHWSNEDTDGVDEAYWAADVSVAQAVQAYHIRQGYTEIGVGTAPEGATEMKLYGSNSGAAWSWLPVGNLVADPASNGWTLIETISASSTGSDTGLRDIASVSYRYWLLRASAGPAAGVGTGWNIQEFELWANPHAGDSSGAARCNHGHNHNDLTGRDVAGGHPATAISETTDGTVQAAIDALRGRSWKQPVRAATTANGTLATAFENGDTIDGVVLATGDRILLKNQTTGAENGIYTVNASGAPTRATDFDSGTEALGAAVLVREGTANADKVFICTTDAPITLGTTALVFAALSGSGVTFGTPAIVLGTAAGAGSVDEVIRRDATIVAFDATAPVTQAFGDAAAAGSAAVAAKRDHKHGMPSAFAGSVVLGGSLGDLPPATPGTYDEEFNGTADTLPTNWAWGTAPNGSDAWFLNSRWPSHLTVEGTGNTSWALVRSSFTPGAGSFGLWAKMYAGPYIASDKVDLRMIIQNSGSTERRTGHLYTNTTTGAHNVRGLKTVASVESTAWGVATPGRAVTFEAVVMYMGLTRDGSNNWTLWYSNNGLSWNRYAAPEAHSFTVDKFEFGFSTSSAQSFLGLDWVRSRSDLLFPRP